MIYDEECVRLLGDISRAALKNRRRRRRHDTPAAAVVHSVVLRNKNGRALSVIKII